MKPNSKIREVDYDTGWIRADIRCKCRHTWLYGFNVHKSCKPQCPECGDDVLPWFDERDRRLILRAAGVRG